MADLREILRRHQTSCPHCREEGQRIARWKREQYDGQRTFERMRELERSGLEQNDYTRGRTHVSLRSTHRARSERALF